MNIYLIYQEVNNDYDTYDSAVVTAETEEAAIMIHPSKGVGWNGKPERWDSWTSSDNVKATLLGRSDSDESGVVLSSYNAG